MNLYLEFPVNIPKTPSQRDMIKDHVRISLKEIWQHLADLWRKNVEQHFRNLLQAKILGQLAKNKNILRHKAQQIAKYIVIPV